MEYYACGDNMKIQQVMPTSFAVIVFKNNSPGGLFSYWKNVPFG
jgi:hypothetical protein